MQQRHLTAYNVPLQCKLILFSWSKEYCKAISAGAQQVKKHLLNGLENIKGITLAQKEYKK